MYWRVLAVLAAGTLFCAACLPPAHSSYISMSNRETGAVDLSAHLGGGSPVYLGGGVQAEPYATSKLSIPITLDIGWGGGTHERAREEQSNYDLLQWYMSGRAGLRLRLREWVSIGLGVGGGYARTIKLVGEIGPDRAEGRHNGHILADLELAIGHRWERIGFSFAIRPTFDAFMAKDDVYGGLLPMEAAIAWYPVNETWGLVLSGTVSLLIPFKGVDEVGVGGAGALGFVYHI